MVSLTALLAAGVAGAAGVAEAAQSAGNSFSRIKTSQSDIRKICVVDLYEAIKNHVDPDLDSEGSEVRNPATRMIPISEWREDYWSTKRYSTGSIYDDCLGLLDEVAAKLVKKTGDASVNAKFDKLRGEIVGLANQKLWESFPSLTEIILAEPATLIRHMPIMEKKHHNADDGGVIHGGEASMVPAELEVSRTPLVILALTLQAAKDAEAKNNLSSIGTSAALKGDLAQTLKAQIDYVIGATAQDAPLLEFVEREIDYDFLMHTCVKSMFELLPTHLKAAFTNHRHNYMRFIKDSNDYSKDKFAFHRYGEGWNDEQKQGSGGKPKPLDDCIGYLANVKTSSEVTEKDKDEIDLIQQKVMQWTFVNKSPWKKAPTQEEIANPKYFMWEVRLKEGVTPSILRASFSLQAAAEAQVLTFEDALLPKTLKAKMFFLHNNAPPS